jgi:pyruvate/2-oxoglutarate dehydrogenase complex dihydrolipoamide dehydrogenase (E3) component
MSQKYDYDLVVIGGGSGGLACAKEAKKLDSKLRVAVCDYVKPSLQGTSWKLGGTCVNVGCVPKKLLHNFGHNLKIIKDMSLDKTDDKLKDGKMKDNEITNNKLVNALSQINEYILSLNWSQKKQLQTAEIDFYNSHAEFIDEHTIQITSDKNVEFKTITSNVFVIATGGRPNYGTCIGAELCLTSDDIFWLRKGRSIGKKVLIIGGGYIALECASFLNEFDVQVDVMFRSKLLKKFDQQCVEQVAELMERNGVRFIRAEPTEIKKSKGIFEVLTIDGKYEGPYDNVILAIGRNPCSLNIGLEQIKIKLNTINNNKIVVNSYDVTTVPNIYAIGDVATVIDSHSYEVGTVCEVKDHKQTGQRSNPKGTIINVNDIGGYDVKLNDGTVIEDIDYNNLMTETIDRPELTPVAIKTGILLAQRLFNQGSDIYPFNDIPSWIPTTVFTSTSYSFAGMTSEEADEKYGKDNIEVWHSRYGPIEQLITHPKFTKSKSNLFTGSNLWSRKYAQENGIHWNDICFNTEDYSEVLYKNKPYTITNIRYDEKINKYKYTIEKSKEKSNQIEVFLRDLSPTLMTEEYEFERHIKSDHLCKLVTEKKTGKILGIHFVGDNAGEIIQGFALACSLGMSKSDLDKSTSIHPIAAEEFLVLDISRSSKKSFLKKEGCGGGSC